MKTSFTCGVDEVGRGPLAGPVVAAAVVLPDTTEVTFIDSKKLTEKKRALLFPKIIETCTQWCIAAAGPITIDKLNIREATKLCMKLCIERLEVKSAYVDGNMRLETDIEHFPIIKGDQKIQAISAASILAKVWRDNLMERYDTEFPYYEFKKHKGYPSKTHREAIAEHGPCKIHRYSFRPVSEFKNNIQQEQISEESDIFLISSRQGDSPNDEPRAGKLRREDSRAVS